MLSAQFFADNFARERAVHIPACPRYPAAKLRDVLPPKYFEALEQNQKIASCCRHPENHEVEARKTHPEETAPDIYIFHCTCRKQHRYLCAGVNDERPSWGAA